MSPRFSSEIRFELFQEVHFLGITMHETDIAIAGNAGTADWWIRSQKESQHLLCASAEILA